jgi:uncharacterized membrane protein YccF (DUF307 family)
MSAPVQTCPTCGTALQPADRFCPSCGAPRPVATSAPAPPATETAPAPPPSAIGASPWQTAPPASNSTAIVVAQEPQYPFVVRALWFLFIGWWLSGWVILAGYVAMLTIVGIPLAFYLFNRLPQALTLRRRTTAYRTEFRDGTAYVTAQHPPQRPWPVRALYFVLVGWWLGAIWLTIAWLLSLPVVTLPLTVWMTNRTGGVMTLQRH